MKFFEAFSQEHFATTNRFKLSRKGRVADDKRSE